MLKVELVFFEGCPNVDRARQEILNSGISKFSEIRQNDLPEGSPYLKFSSPTILYGGKIVAGGECGASACSVIEWTLLKAKLRVE